MFNKGDLVYIPQGVTLIGVQGADYVYDITSKPELAVFVRYIKDDAEIVTTNGSLWSVDSRKIYFNKNPELENACRAC